MGLFLLFLFLGIFALILAFTIGPHYVSPSVSPNLKEGLLSEDGTSYIGEKEAVPYIESYSIVYHAESRTRYARIVYTGKAHSLAYDLFLFDKNHRPFKVLTLDFPIIDEKTKTHYIALPPSTRGLLIRIREADGASYPKDDQKTDRFYYHRSLCRTREFLSQYRFHPYDPLLLDRAKCSFGQSFPFPLYCSYCCGFGFLIQLLLCSDDRRSSLLSEESEEGRSSYGSEKSSRRNRTCFRKQRGR